MGVGKGAAAMSFGVSLFLSLCAFALAEVVQLNPFNYNDLVLNSKKAVFVKFYAPGCGYCRQMAPAWKSLADNMSDHVTIAELNCQEFGSFCSNLKMTGSPALSGYPTLRLFAMAQADDKRFNVDYTGQREAKPMADFAELHANSFVYTIQPSYSAKEKSRNKRLVTLEEFLSKGSSLPKVILFRAAKSTVSLPVKSLSVKYYRKLVIGQIFLPAQTTLSRKYKTPSDTDSLLVIPPVAGMEPIRYTGQLKFSPLVDFLAQYADKSDWDLAERHTTEL